MTTRVRIIDPAKLQALYIPARKSEPIIIEKDGKQIELRFTFLNPSFASQKTELFLIEVNLQSRFIEATSNTHIEEDGNITVNFNGKQGKLFRGELMDNFLLALQAKLSAEGDLLELQERTEIDSSFEWVDVTSNQELTQLLSKHLQLLS